MGRERNGGDGERCGVSVGAGAVAVERDEWGVRAAAAGESCSATTDAARADA